MTICYLILTGLLLTLGVIGCVVPMIPGPFLAYAGVLCLCLTPHMPSTGFLIGAGVFAGLVTVLDYLIPAWGAKRFHCTRWGTWGCVVGTFVGLLFMPLGLLMGPFLGSVLGELMGGRDLPAAATSAVGALVGVLCGMLIKLTFCLSMVYYYLKVIING